MATMMYKKRAGTSGISGQLYETKLVSLILFKLLHDDSIEEFYLASNMDEIGAFDDICFKAKIAGYPRPILVFIQAKHKEDINTFLNYDLIKNFHASYVQVKENFYATKSQDVLFESKFEDIDCLFILYTNAKFYEDLKEVELNKESTSAELVPAIEKQTQKTYQSSFAEKLARLIGTGEEYSQGVQAEYTTKDLELANDKILEEEINTLAEHFTKFLNDQSLNIMLDKYIIQYHVMLAQSVVHISDVKSEEIKPTQKRKVKKPGQKPLQNELKPQANTHVQIAGKSKDNQPTPPLEQLSDIKSKEGKPEQKQNAVEIRKYRDMTFRDEFLLTDDKILTILRNKIYEIVINNQIRNKKKPKLKENDDLPTTDSYNSTEDKLISAFLSEPSGITLSPLIGTYIIYEDNKLKFTINRPNTDLQTLEQINNMLQSDMSLIVNEAEIIAARDFLLSLKLKVPASFGNIDLTIPGDSDKIVKRINILMAFIEKLCQTSKLVDDYQFVTVDKSMGEGFLSLSNGIGSGIGNLFVYDETTKCLKFTENYASLKTNARLLFDKLNDNINLKNNLNLYRFDTKAINTFPKLVFDFTTEAKSILDKVVVYEKQGNHYEVENKLKTEIEKHQSTNGPQNFSIKSDTKVIYYHNIIQKWWMSPMGHFFIKSSDVYKKAIDEILQEPHISAMKTTFYMNNINKFRYDFNNNAINTVAPVKHCSRTIIVTNISALTIVKVIQCLKNKDNVNDAFNNAVLDVECMLSLSPDDFVSLSSELKDTNKLLVVVCNGAKNKRILHKRLDVLADAIVDKRIIVITNNFFLETVVEYFEGVDIILNDERQSLIDLTPESRRHITKNTEILFQGKNVNLDSLVDDKSVSFIQGVVLNKIVHNETVAVGTTLSNSSYEKIQHLYVDRKVFQASNDNNLDNTTGEEPTRKGYFVRSFEDIKENFVLITATPGMGKSTLLTHLSLKTKEHDRQLWIVRINLLDHSKAFFDWQTHKTVIDILETLKIICQIILKNHNLPIRLQETDNKVYLDSSTGDEWANFEVNMFLYFYNERKLLFLFDGFDEICPHYKDSVINFLKVVMTYPRKHKMWVTSRPYSEILPDLQRVLGKSYELEFISDSDQVVYLNKFWREKLIIEKLNDVQLKTAISYIDFMRPKQSPTIARIFYLFYDYIRWHFPHIITHTNYGKMVSIVLDPYLTDLNAGFAKRQVDIVMGTPLLLYLYGNYFVRLVCDGNTNVNWNLKIHDSTLTVYEVFIDTKLKILFEDKNEMDVYKPDIIKKYEKDYIECVTLHKKIAAYTLFFHRIHLDELKELRPFNQDKEYKDVINEIKCGKEKIGLISHVTPDNIPVFIYKTLEEYFAAEFLFDIFKNDKIDIACKNMLYSIAHVTFGIFSWMNRKRAVDSELNTYLLDIERKRPATVSTYGYLFATGWSIEQLIRIRSSSKEDYDSDCFAEYNENFIKILRRLEPQERDIQLKQFQKNVIAKMKPSLRQHFTPFPGENSEYA